MSNELVRAALDEYADRDLAPLPDVWPNIYKQLHRKARPATPKWKLVSAGALLMLVVVATIIMVEPARTWAEGTTSTLLSYFGFNQSKPVQPGANSKAGPHPAGAAQNCVQVTSRVSWCLDPGMEFLNRQQAESRAGYAVKSPGYVPGNYEAANGFIVRADARLVTSDWYYTGLSFGQCGADTPITLVRTPAGQTSANEIAIGKAQTTEVKIGTSTGLWIEKAPTAWCSDGSGKRITMYQSFLAWESDGVRYWLSVGSEVDLNQALKIARSIP